MCGAKNIALANTVLLTETREVLPVNSPVSITSPSKGTGKTTGDIPPYVYWLDLIDQQQHLVLFLSLVILFLFQLLMRVRVA